MSRNQKYPPLRDLVLEGPEDDSLGWYYGDHAGGMIFNFGKHKGRKLHAVCLSYLYWCYGEAHYCNRPTLCAIKVYFAGLKEYAKENYLAFVVPFGKKHGGQIIGEYRDKKWMAWTYQQRGLREKFPHYFVALEYHFRNPHFNHTRDIGELLDATEYADDLDLQDEDHNEADLEDLVVSDGHVKYESDAESESDPDEGCAEGMKVRQQGGNIIQAKKSRSSTVAPKGKSSPKKPFKKTPKNTRDSVDSFLVDDSVSDGDASFEFSSTETDSRGGNVARAGESKGSTMVFKGKVSPKERSKKMSKNTRDSLDGFLVNDSASDDEASFESSSTETDSEVVSTVSSIDLTLLAQVRQATPELCSNKSASKEDSGHTTPPPKSKRTNQCHNVQRHSNNKDVFSDDVQVPESSHSKLCRTKTIVESEDEPPPTVRSPKPREKRRSPALLTQRQATPPSDSDGVEEEAESEGLNESDDFRGKAQSPGPSVPITPRRRGILTDDEDEVEWTCTEKPPYPSKQQLRVKTSRVSDDEAGKQIPTRNSSSRPRILAPQQRKLAALRRSMALESEEPDPLRLKTNNRTTLKRKKPPSPEAYNKSDEELTSNATRPEPTVPKTRHRRRRLLQEPPLKKARHTAVATDSSDEESSPPSPVREDKKSEPTVPKTPPHKNKLPQESPFKESRLPALVTDSSDEESLPPPSRFTCRAS